MAGSGGRGKSGSATATKSSGGVVLPPGVTMEESEGSRRYAFQSSSGDRLSFTVEPFDTNLMEIGFSVNNSMNRNNSAPKDGLEIAFKVRNIMRAEAASRPEGFGYITTAAQGDGLGKERAVLYTRAGFSQPFGGNPGQAQYAAVRGGRLRPDNEALANHNPFW